MTWGMLLREGQQKLMPAFPDESDGEVRQEVRFLLSWASGHSTAWLLARTDDPMTADAHVVANTLATADAHIVANTLATADAHVVADRFRAALSRRAHREPVAYIIGRAGFCGHIFGVNPSVLIPRPDTELLVETVSDFLRNLDMGLNEKARSPNSDNLTGTSHFARILEIGTGSGCISCSLALNHENARITAVDLSAEALCVAQSNADRLGVSGRIRFLRADILSASSSSFLTSNPAEWDLPTNAPVSNPPKGPFSATPERDALYDVLVSNPPYIPSADLAGLMPDVLQYEPHIALDGGADGLLFYRRLLQISKDLLKYGGLLAVEIGHDQGVTVPDLFREERFSPTVYSDLGGNPRVVAGIFSGPHPVANK